MLLLDLQAAEKRQRTSAVLGGLMPKGPHLLGGGKTGTSPAEVPFAKLMLICRLGLSYNSSIK